MEAPRPEALRSREEKLTSKEITLRRNIALACGFDENNVAQLPSKDELKDIAKYMGRIMFSPSRAENILGELKEEYPAFAPYFEQTLRPLIVQAEALPETQSNRREEEKQYAQEILRKEINATYHGQEVVPFLSKNDIEIIHEALSYANIHRDEADEIAILLTERFPHISAYIEKKLQAAINLAQQDNE